MRNRFCTMDPAVLCGIGGHFEQWKDADLDIRPIFHWVSAPVSRPSDQGGAEPRSSGRISGARPIGVPQSSAADARALSNNMTAATFPKLRTVYLQIRND